MKSKGLHEYQDSRQCGTLNLGHTARKKSRPRFVILSRQFDSRLFGMRTFMFFPQRHHFAQHAQAIVNEIDFAPLGMVPAHGNFADAQSGALREIKQLHIEGEAVDASGFENRPTNIEAERFETTLRIPKRQAGGKPHKKVENAATLFAPRGLVPTDQAAIDRARTKRNIDIAFCYGLDHRRRLAERRGKIRVEKKTDRFLCRQQSRTNSSAFAAIRKILEQLRRDIRF